MRTLCLVPVLLTGWAFAQSENPRWECRTSSEHPSPAGGYLSCSIAGPCDTPAVRDGFLPAAGTPIRWLRLHLIVFRADDGTDAAETPGDILGQMDTVNLDFLPYGIQFCYTWQYVDDSTWRYDTGAEEAMKTAYALDPLTRCNVFINELDGGLGYFPWDPNALNASGGIVLGRDYFSPAHHVLTHELGHNLGLWHLHHGVEEVAPCDPCYEEAGSASDTTGDFAADTPPGPSDFGVCAPPGTVDGCSSNPWGDTQRENYMSYGSGDGLGCWTLFTPQQAARMHCWADSALSTWHLDVDECVEATVGPDPGSGVNPDILTATAVVTGGVWSVTLAAQAGRGPGSWVLLLRAASTPGTIVDLGLLLGLPASGPSELLVDPLAFLANFVPPPHGGGGTVAQFSVPVPLDGALLGNGWAAQAVVLGDLPQGAGGLDPWFSTAMRGVIGSL